jgi:pimeloyl-ACP methyl ester carboxylesterase
MSKIPVYFVPGLAASPAIFERIKLPEDQFETILLEWKLPIKGESVIAYTKRLAEEVTLPNPVLIGVSFGGIIVQEMSKLIPVRKVIIISSAKCNAEFPKRMRFAKFTKAYKLIPTGMVNNIEKLTHFTLAGKKVNDRLKLYEKYLGVRDKSYLDWALEKVITWDRKVPDDKVVHIHGDADEIFPCKYLHNFIPVPGGTHIMIINKYKWLNENLPKIILADPVKEN